MNRSIRLIRNFTTALRAPPQPAAELEKTEYEGECSGDLQHSEQQMHGGPDVRQREGFHRSAAGTGVLQDSRHFRTTGLPLMTNADLPYSPPGVELNC